MMPSSKTVRVLLAAAAIGCAAFQPAFAAEHECPKGDLPQAGTMEATITTVGFIIGARWGEGTLTLNDGTTRKINLEGAKLLETGAAEVTMKGKVFNLSKLEDFPGDYGAVSAGLTVVKGLTGGILMSNDNCVYINAEVQSEGLQLSAPAPGGILISFEE